MASQQQQHKSYDLPDGCVPSISHKSMSLSFDNEMQMRNKTPFLAVLTSIVVEEVTNDDKQDKICKSHLMGDRIVLIMRRQSFRFLTASSTESASSGDEDCMNGMAQSLMPPQQRRT